MNEEKVNQLISERAIREIVDLYANHADTKQTDLQVSLFSDDYVLEVYYDSTSETPTQTITGKDNLKQLFLESLSPFSKTMHFNGQSIIELKNENEAEGTVYCRAYHQNTQNGTEQFMIAVIKYLDKYVRINEKWFFSERKLKVQWVENR